MYSFYLESSSHEFKSNSCSWCSCITTIQFKTNHWAFNEFIIMAKSQCQYIYWLKLWKWIWYKLKNTFHQWRHIHLQHQMTMQLQGLGLSNASLHTYPRRTSKKKKLYFNTYILRFWGLIRKFLYLQMKIERFWRRKYKYIIKKIS